MLQECAHTFLIISIEMTGSRLITEKDEMLELIWLTDLKCGKCGWWTTSGCSSVAQDHVALAAIEQEANGMDPWREIVYRILSHIYIYPSHWLYTLLNNGSSMRCEMSEFLRMWNYSSPHNLHFLHWDIELLSLKTRISHYSCIAISGWEQECRRYIKKNQNRFILSIRQKA